MAQSINIRSSVAAGYTAIVEARPDFQGGLSSLIFSCSDDIDWEVFIDKPNLNTLTRMITFSLNASSSGGTIPRDTIVYFRVTTVDVNGKESAPTSIINKKTGSSNTSSIVVSWAAIIDATSYNIYAANKAGQEYLVGQTTSLSWTLTELPSARWNAIPTAPDITFSSVKGVYVIPLNSNVPLSSELVVYVRAYANVIVTFSTLVA